MPYPVILLMRKELVFSFLQLTDFFDNSENCPAFKGADRMTLKELKPGWTATVKTISGLSPSRRRLIDMGITPGVAVSVLKTAPFGDPGLIRVRGYLLSLRKSDTKQIIIEEVQKNEGCLDWKSKLRKNNAF